MVLTMDPAAVAAVFILLWPIFVAVVTILLLSYLIWCLQCWKQDRWMAGFAAGQAWQLRGATLLGPYYLVRRVTVTKPGSVLFGFVPHNHWDVYYSLKTPGLPEMRCSCDGNSWRALMRDAQLVGSWAASEHHYPVIVRNDGQQVQP